MYEHVCGCVYGHVVCMSMCVAMQANVLDKVKLHVYVCMSMCMCTCV